MGIIHRNLTIEQQANEVDKVKRSESGMIVDPVTMHPTDRVSDALEVMRKYKISGVPITEHDKLPKKAKDYLRFIQKESGAEIGMVSTGPDRDHTIFVDEFSAILKK